MIEEAYIKACDQIILYGHETSNERTGVGTKVCTNVVLEQPNVDRRFPMLLSKKVAWKPMVGELLWFIEGSTNVNRLAEITYGDPERKTIWTDNYTDFQTKHEGINLRGALGPVYGSQWRKWEGAEIGTIDQLTEVVQRIKTNPSDRRLVVSAWNPSDVPYMALPPCHMIFQFNVVGDRLDLLMMQRSGDMFLGVPFNIASYALLMKLVAKETDLIAGKLTIVIGNAHIYSNHYEQVKRQSNNWWHKVNGWDLGIPDVSINTEQSMFSGEITVDDIVLSNYNPIESIKGVMAV